MSCADSVSRDTRRVVLAQALLTVGVAIGALAFAGLPQMLAVLYGGAITILLTAWLAWRMRRAGSLAAIYSGVLARYALAAAAIGVGIGLLGLSPLPLLGAFAVTQFGFLVLLRRPCPGADKE